MDMSTAKRMWFWAVLLPILTLVGLTMCVWPIPPSLGFVALMLLWFSTWTVLFLIAAVSASLWYAATGLIHRKKNGELVRRCSMSLVNDLMFLWVRL